MQLATSIETDNGEMIVKQVSVPIGLEELMEGLTKEVLLKKPKDIYVFASEYFAKLLELREKGAYKVIRTRKAQFASKQTIKEKTSKLKVNPTTSPPKKVPNGTAIFNSKEKTKSFFDRRKSRNISSSSGDRDAKKTPRSRSTSSSINSSSQSVEKRTKQTTKLNSNQEKPKQSNQTRNDNKNRVEEKIVSSKMRRTPDLDGVEIIAKTAPMVVKGMQRIPSKHSVDSTKNKTTESCRNTESIINNEQAKIVGCKMTNSAAIDLIDHKLENKENMNGNSKIVSSLKKSREEDDSSKDVKIDGAVLDKIKEDIEHSKSTEDDKKEKADENKGKSNASKNSVGTLEPTRIRSGTKLEGPTESGETQPGTSIKSDDLESSSSETIPAEINDISKNQPKENSSQNSSVRKEEDSAETVAPTTVERVAKLEDVTENREKETITSEASNEQEKSASEQSKITMAKTDDPLEDKSKEVAATTLENGAKHKDATENREVTSEASSDQERNVSEQLKITEIDDKLEGKPKEYPLQVTIEDKKEDNNVNENFIETGKSGAKLKSTIETVEKETDTFKRSNDEKKSVSEQSKVTETKTGSTSRGKPAEETPEEVKGENSFGDHSVKTVQSSVKVVEGREKEGATPTSSHDQEKSSLEKTNTDLAKTGDTLKSNREENCVQSTAEERAQVYHNRKDSHEAVVPTIEESQANLGRVTENSGKEAVTSEAIICQETSTSEQSKVTKAVIDDASVGNSNSLEETPKETTATTTLESVAKPKVMTESSESVSNISSGQAQEVSESSKIIKAQTDDTLEDKPKEVPAQNTTQQKKEVNHPIEDSIRTIVPTVNRVDDAQKHLIENRESQTVEEVTAKKTTDSNVESPVEQINDKEEIIAQQSSELLRNSKHISKATEDFLSNEQNNIYSSFLHSSTDKDIPKENRNHSVASELASSIGGMHQELLRSIDQTNNFDQSKDEDKNLPSEAKEDDSIIVEAIEMKDDAKKSIEHNATETEHNLQNLSNLIRKENKSTNQTMSESNVSLSHNDEKAIVKKPEKDGNEVSTSTASPASTVQRNDDSAKSNNETSDQDDKKHPQKEETKNQKESDNVKSSDIEQELPTTDENATNKEHIVKSTENIDSATKTNYTDPKIDEDTSIKTDTNVRMKRSVEDTGVQSSLLLHNTEKNQNEDEAMEKSCDVGKLEKDQLKLLKESVSSKDQEKSSGAIIQLLSAEKGIIEETKTNRATIGSSRSIVQEKQDDKLTIRPKIEEANEGKRGCEENLAEINEKINTSEIKGESVEKTVLSQDLGLPENTEVAATDSKIERATNESLKDKNIETTMKESGKENFNKLEEIKKESSTEYNNEIKNEDTEEKSVEGNTIENNKKDDNNLRELPGEKTVKELKNNDISGGSSSSEEATNKPQIQEDKTGKDTIPEIKSTEISKAPTNLEKTDQTTKSVKEEEDTNKSENNVGLGDIAVEIGSKKQFFREQTNIEGGQDKNNGDKASIIKENITPEKSDIVPLETKETKKELEGKSGTSQTSENLIETKANQQDNEDNVKIGKLSKQEEENEDNKVKQPFFGEDFISQEATLVEEKNINTFKELRKAELEDKRENGGTETISSKDFNDRERSTSEKSKTSETKATVTLEVESRENTDKSKSKSEKIEDKQPVQEATLVKEKDIDTLKESNTAMLENKTENVGKKTISSKAFDGQQASTSGKSKNPETKEDVTLEVQSIENTDNSEKIEDKQTFLGEDSVSKKTDLVEEKHINTPVSSSKAELEDKTENGEKETISSKDSNDHETSTSGKSKTPETKEDVTLEVESKDNTDNSEKVENKQPFLDEDPVSKKANLVEEKYINTPVSSSNAELEDETEDKENETISSKDSNNQETSSSGKSKTSETKEDATLAVQSKQNADNSEKIEDKQPFLGEDSISKKTNLVEEKHINPPVSSSKAELEDKTENGEKETISSKDSNTQETSSSGKSKTPESKEDATLVVESKENTDNSEKIDDKQPFLGEDSLSKKANLVEEKHINIPVSSSKSELKDKIENGEKETIPYKESNHQEKSASRKSEITQTNADGTSEIRAKRAVDEVKEKSEGIEVKQLLSGEILISEKTALVEEEQSNAIKEVTEGTTALKKEKDQNSTVEETSENLDKESSHQGTKRTESKGEENRPSVEERHISEEATLVEEKQESGNDKRNEGVKGTIDEKQVKDQQTKKQKRTEPTLRKSASPVKKISEKLVKTVQPFSNDSETSTKKSKDDTKLKTTRNKSSSFDRINSKTSPRDTVNNKQKHSLTKSKSHQRFVENNDKNTKEETSEKRRPSPTKRTKRSASLEVNDKRPASKNLNKHQVSLDSTKHQGDIENTPKDTKIVENNLRQQLKKKRSKLEDVVDQATAAVKIQALWRGFATRKALSNRKKENTVNGMKIADAVIKIQALWRGFNVRNLKRRGELFGKTVETEATKTEDLRSTRKLREKKINSALKIQSLWRGYKVRKGIKDVNNKLGQIQEPSEVQRNAPTDEDIMKAATKIQANMRGYMVRKKLPKKPMMSIVEENSGDVKTEQITRSNTVDEPKCVQKFVPTLVDPEELPKILDNSKNNPTNDDATHAEGYKIPRDNSLETKDSIDLSTNKQNLVMARLNSKDEIKCEIDDNYETLPTRPVISNLSKQHTETDNDIDEIGGESKSSSRTHSCKSTSSTESRQTVIFNDEFDSESKAEREELARDHREQIEQKPKTETKEESKQKEIEEKSVSSQGKEQDIETLTSDTKGIKNNQGSSETKEDKDEKVDVKQKEIVKLDDGEHNSSIPNPQEQNISVTNVDQKDSELSHKSSLGLQKFLIDISKDGKALKPDSKINEDKSMETKAERRESVGSKDGKNDIINDTVEDKTENRTASKKLEKKEQELLKTDDDIVVIDDHSAKEQNMDKPKNGLIPSKITSVDEPTDETKPKLEDGNKNLEKEKGSKSKQENDQKSESLEKFDSFMKQDDQKNLELQEKEKQKGERNATEGSTEMKITEGSNIEPLVEDQKSEIKKISKTEQPPNENAKTEKTKLSSIDEKDCTRNENLLESLGNQNSVSRGEKNVSLPSKTENVSRDAVENLENTTTEEHSLDLRSNKTEDSINFCNIGNEATKNEEKLDGADASTANRNSKTTEELQDTEGTINKNEGATRVEEDLTQRKMNHEEAQKGRSDPLKDNTNEANLAEIQKEQVNPVTNSAISNEDDQKNDAIKSSPESDHQLPFPKTSADNVTLNSLPADNLEKTSANEVSKTTTVQRAENETKENQKDAGVVEIEEQSHKELKLTETNNRETSKSVSTNVEINKSEKASENDENSNDSIVKSDSPYNKVNSPLLEEEIEKFNEKINRTILNDLDDDRITTTDPDTDALRIPLRELSDIKEEEENMKAIEDDKIRIEGDGEEMNNKTTQVLNSSTNRGGEQHEVIEEQQQQQPTITNRDNLPITVQLTNAAPPAGVQKLTSPVSGSNDDDGDADNSDAADGRNSSKQAAQASSKDASPTITESDNFEKSTTIQRVDRDMDTTEKRNNINNNLSKRNMEAEAATKIQAGFRGYQVRKQLKNKHTTGDISNQRRLVRRKSSGQMKKNNQTTTATTSPRDIEEQSAVKIQAGVRGFLVRRRQKKEKSKETTSST